jgi:tetratricopeptide (TPR) repeat protein
LIGKRLGDYLLTERLGSGAMGTVYLGVRGDERFAVKVLHPHLLDRPGYFKRFQQEAHVGQRIRHPNVVRAYDADMQIVDDVSHCYLVMEYVEGQTLKDLLADLGPLPEELVAEIARQAAAGLQAIHEHAIHRDLKPANILITGDEVVKVMDLGIARLEDPRFVESTEDLFRGSILYASPEQLASHGRPLDGRSDLYSLGVVLHELATGRHPFDGSDLGRVVHRILHEDPPALTEARDDLSRFLTEVVAKLLVKDRDGRFADAGELLEVLHEGERSAWWQQRETGESIPPVRRPFVPRETAVHGREGPLATLVEAFERARAGEGRVVLLEGPAGIGKTRLVDELCARLLRTEGEIELLVGTYPPGGAASGIDAFRRALDDRLGAGPLASRLRGLLPESPGLVEPLAAALRGEPPPGGSDPLAREWLHAGIVRLVCAIAGRGPVLFLVDDLHFAPADGLGLFASLAQAAAGHRILLIGTTRHRIEAAWQADLERLSHVSRISLAELDDTAVESIVGEALASDTMLEALGPSVASRSGGNPLFALHILRDLRERGVLVPREAGGWDLSQPVGDLPIPDTVAHLVEARFAGLEEEDQSVLEVAACYGFEFDPLVIADVVGRPPISVLRRLGWIERTRGLVRASARRFTFDHHHVQETLLTRVSQPLREAYDAQIATALLARLGAEGKEIAGAPAAEIVDHALRGGRPDLALPHLEAALDHLQHGDQYEWAADLARRALPHVDDRPAKIDLLVRSGGLSEHLGRYDSARADLVQAIDLAGREADPCREASARTELGRLLGSIGELEEALSTLEAAVALAVQAGDARTEAPARSELGIVLANRGRLEEAEAACRASLDLARAAGDRRGEAKATGNLGLIAWRRDELDEARKRFEQCIRALRGTGDRRSEASVHGLLGLILDGQAQYEAAARMFERQRKLAREIGYRRGEAIATSNLGDSLSSLGRIDEARRHLERSVRLAEEIGNRPGVASALINLGSAQRQLGLPEESNGSLTRSLLLSREIENPTDEALSLLGLARLQAEQSQPEEALRHCEAALALGPAIDTAIVTAWARFLTGTVLLDLDRRSEAVEHFEAAVAEETAPMVLVLGICYLALLGKRTPDEARALLEEHGPALPPEERIRAHLIIYRAGGRLDDLRSAYDLLREWLESFPEGPRGTISQGFPLCRDVEEAWRDVPWDEKRRGTG